ncbi:hypothetical protein [Streptomyces sp. NPDC051014]
MVRLHPSAGVWFVPPPGIPLAAFAGVVPGEIAHRGGRRTYGVRGGVK